MCANCFGVHFAGREVPPLTPGMRVLAERLREFDKHNPLGGGLHIVTDDWNLSDAHIGACLEQGLSGEEYLIAGGLLVLTEDERYVVMRASGAV